MIHHKIFPTLYHYKKSKVAPIRSDLWLSASIFRATVHKNCCGQASQLQYQLQLVLRYEQDWQIAEKLWICAFHKSVNSSFQQCLLLLHTFCFHCLDIRFSYFKIFCTFSNISHTAVIHKIVVINITHQMMNFGCIVLWSRNKWATLHSLPFGGALIIFNMITCWNSTVANCQKLWNSIWCETTQMVHTSIPV